MLLWLSTIEKGEEGGRRYRDKGLGKDVDSVGDPDKEHRILKKEFECWPVEPKSLKGFNNKVKVYEVELKGSLQARRRNGLLDDNQMLLERSVRSPEPFSDDGGESDKEKSISLKSKSPPSVSNDVVIYTPFSIEETLPNNNKIVRKKYILKKKDGTLVPMPDDYSPHGKNASIFPSSHSSHHNNHNTSDQTITTSTSNSLKSDPSPASSPYGSPKLPHLSDPSVISTSTSHSTSPSSSPLDEDHFDFINKKVIHRKIIKGKSGTKVIERVCTSSEAELLLKKKK